MPLAAFLFSRMCSVFGMQIIACTYIFRLVETGIDAYGLSQLGLAATFASVLMALPTGVVVDRIPKNIAILFSHAVLLVVTLIATRRNSFDFTEILLTTGFLAMARNFRSISQFTVFGELLKEKANKSRWVNLSTLSWQIAAFLAPILAGTIGSGQRSLVLSAIFISFSLLTQFYIVRFLPKASKAAEPTSDTDFAKLIRTNFKLSSSMALDFFIVLFAGASSLLPFLHTDKISTMELGLLKSALPAGVIFGTFLKLHKTSLENWSEKLFVATAGYGICHVFLAESASITFSFLLLFGAGIFDAISLTIRECILQLETPPHLKGRIYSLNNFLVNASDELSEWESGLSAHWLGVRSAINLSGTIAILGAGAFLWRAKNRVIEPTVETLPQ